MSDQRIVGQTSGGVDLPLSAFQETDNTGSVQTADPVARQQLEQIRQDILTNYGNLTAAAEALTSAANIINNNTNFADGLGAIIPNYQHIADYAHALDFLTIYQDGLVKKIGVDGLIRGGLAQAKLADVQITQEHITAGGPGYAYFQVSTQPFDSASDITVWIDGRWMEQGYGWRVSDDSAGIEAWLPDAGPERDAYIANVLFTVRWFE